MADSRETRACCAMCSNGSSWKGQRAFLGEVQGVLSVAHRCGKHEGRTKSSFRLPLRAVPLQARLRIRHCIASHLPQSHANSGPVPAYPTLPTMRLLSRVSTFIWRLLCFSPRNILLHPCRSLALHVVSFPFPVVQQSYQVAYHHCHARCACFLIERAYVLVEGRPLCDV